MTIRGIMAHQSLLHKQSLLDPIPVPKLNSCEKMMVVSHEECTLFAVLTGASGGSIVLSYGRKESSGENSRTQ